MTNPSNQPCYTCNTLFTESDPVKFNLTGHGERIVHICDDCLAEVANATKGYQWGESICGSCGYEGGCTGVDGSIIRCLDCLEREVVAAMRASRPIRLPTFKNPEAARCNQIGVGTFSKRGF